MFPAQELAVLLDLAAFLVAREAEHDCHAVGVFFAALAQHVLLAADGLIWTIGHALDPAWRVTLGANARQLPPLEAETKVHDTMLEVWNPITKQRAKGVRINAVLMGFAGDAVVFSPRVEGERVVMDLWRVRQ